MNYIEMTTQEIEAMILLLKELKPHMSLEIGRYKGGSLGIISKHSFHTYSVDPLPFNHHLKNTTIIVGRSPEDVYSIPETSLDFVFIDGDHSTKAVAADIEAVMTFGPKVVLLHDSYMDTVRKAIQDYHWNNYDVHIDWVKGFIPTHPIGRAVVGIPCSGLCLATRK